MEAIQIKDLIVMAIAVFSAVASVAGVWASLNSRLTKLETRQDTDDSKFSDFQESIRENRSEIDEIRHEVNNKIEQKFGGLEGTLQNVLRNQTEQYSEIRGLLKLYGDSIRRHEDEINRLRKN